VFSADFGALLGAWVTGTDAFDRHALGEQATDQASGNVAGTDKGNSGFVHGERSLIKGACRSRVRQTAPCRRVPRWRLRQWRLRGRGSCPWKVCRDRRVARSAVGAGGQTRRVVRGDRRWVRELPSARAA